MSTKENDVWLENAKDNFDDAVNVKNYAHAMAIIGDVKDRGFDKEARILAFELRNIQFSHEQN